MAGTTEQAYAAARMLLEESWRAIESTDGQGVDEALDGLGAKVRAVVEEGSVAQRYAVVTQLLQKLVWPEADAFELRDIVGAPGSISSRSLAKRVVAEFDRDKGAPLGGSRDPYVSQPLRRQRLDPDVATGPDAGRWRDLLEVLDSVEDDPERAEPALRAALAAMREKKHDLHSLITRVLQLQGSSGTSEARERSELVRKVAPEVLRPLLPLDFEAEGSGGLGTPAEVPWFRVFSPEHSSSPQEGWYLCYLFSAGGEVVYLCLTQGVTATSVEKIQERAEEARVRFADVAGLEHHIDLHSRREGGRPKLYERATAVAKAYKSGRVPMTATLELDLEEMLGLLTQVYEEEPAEELGEDVRALTVEAVLETAGEEGIELKPDLVASAVAAIRAGKHILLTGPPGTGKTTFAVALAKAATAAGLSEGIETVTATADWTSAETIGSYWPTPGEERLVFERGPVLRAIDQRAWLIIDELNRADIDKAFGPLFTVLAGQSSRLNLHEEVDGKHLPVEILPAKRQAAGDTAPHEIASQWRLIATLNTRDRDLLFNLSYALLRRFAVIDMGVPEAEEYREILKARAATGDDVADDRLAKLVGLPGRQLGPAILIDCGQYLRERLQLADDPDVELALAEAIAAFILPQLDDLSPAQQVDVLKHLSEKVLVDTALAEVAELLAPTFHATAADLLRAAAADEESELEEES